MILSTKYINPIPPLTRRLLKFCDCRHEFNVREVYTLVKFSEIIVNFPWKHLRIINSRKQTEPVKSI